MTSSAYQNQAEKTAREQAGRDLWSDMMVAACGNGELIPSAINRADVALKAYRARFEPEPEPDAEAAAAVLGAKNLCCPECR